MTATPLKKYILRNSSDLAKKMMIEIRSNHVIPSRGSSAYLGEIVIIQTIRENRIGAKNL